MSRSTASALSASAQGSGRLKVVLLMVIGFMVIEVVAGIASGSLALISDAAHMGTDALGVGMALAAIVASQGGATGLMLVVAIVGLVVNLAGYRMLKVQPNSLNLTGARLELLADLMGSVGVIAAALVVRFTGWLQADSLIAIALGLFVLPRAFKLGREAIRILVQEAPPHLDVGRIKSSLASIPHVVDIHDLHVWTLTSGMEVASAHLMIENGADPHPVLDSARHLLKQDFAINHATLQVEPQSHVGCTELSW